MEKAGFNQPKTQPLTALPTSPGPCWLGKAALQNMVRRDADSSRVWLRALALLRSSRTLLLPGTWGKRTGSHGYHWGIPFLQSLSSSFLCEQAQDTDLLETLAVPYSSRKAGPFAWNPSPRMSYKRSNLILLLHPPGNCTFLVCDALMEGSSSRVSVAPCRAYQQVTLSCSSVVGSGRPRLYYASTSE